MDSVIKLIKIITAIVVALLGLELLLKLLGAKPTLILFEWIYKIGDFLGSPFAGILPSYTFGSRFVLDFSILFAMIAYVIFAGIVIWLLKQAGKGSSKH